MLKAVIFDLDNTLINWDLAEPPESRETRRIKELLAFVHDNLCPIPEADPEKFFAIFSTNMGEAWMSGQQTMIAPSLKHILAETLQSCCGVPEDKLDMDAVMQAYNWQAVQGEQAFPDVLEVLPQIQKHGVELGIITNSTHTMSDRDRELQAFGLLELFPNCRIAAVDVGYLKPHRNIFDHALKMLNIQPDEAVFVGDDLRADIQGAQNAGMYAVLRVRDREQALDQEDIVPDGMIISLHELLPLLDAWYPGWRKGATP